MECKAAAFCLFLTVACLFLSPGNATGRDGTDTVTSRQSKEKSCYPPCRNGFACVDGACASPCNPACWESEVCTRNGKCLPSAAHAPARSPAAAPARRWSASAGEVVRQKQFNDEYVKARNKRNMGVGLLVPGLFGILGAGVMGFSAGYYGNENLLLAGIAVETVGVLLFIPGLVNAVKGNKIMRRLRRENKVSVSSDGLSLTLHF